MKIVRERLDGVMTIELQQFADNRGFFIERFNEQQFREAGLLREVAVDASRSYFDTDTSDHHHFYLEDEQRVIDIPSSAIVIQNLPEPPQGMNITHVDVVVRVKKSR